MTKRTEVMLQFGSDTMLSEGQKRHANWKTQNYVFTAFFNLTTSSKGCSLVEQQFDSMMHECDRQSSTVGSTN